MTTPRDTYACKLANLTIEPSCDKSTGVDCRYDTPFQQRELLWSYANEDGIIPPCSSDTHVLNSISLCSQCQYFMNLLIRQFCTTVVCDTADKLLGFTINCCDLFSIGYCTARGIFWLHCPGDCITLRRKLDFERSRNQRQC